MSKRLMFFPNEEWIALLLPVEFDWKVILDTELCHIKNQQRIEEY